MADVINENNFIHYLATDINIPLRTVRTRRNIIYNNIKNIFKANGLRNNTFHNFRNVLEANYTTIFNNLFNLYDEHFFNGFLNTLINNPPEQTKYILFSIKNFTPLNI
tara:strand:- start:591 stop:914 length:324 start_codon:yes stop_codon:yes gene_type:complete